MLFPTLALEMIAVEPKRPHESQEEEGGGGRPRIADARIRRRNEQIHSDPITENSATRPLCPHKTEETDNGAEDSLHDANEEGCEMACEMVEEGTR